MTTDAEALQVYTLCIVKPFVNFTCDLLLLDLLIMLKYCGKQKLELI